MASRQHWLVTLAATRRTIVSSMVPIRRCTWTGMDGEDSTATDSDDSSMLQRAMSGIKIPSMKIPQPLIVMIVAVSCYFQMMIFSLTAVMVIKKNFIKLTFP